MKKFVLLIVGLIISIVTSTISYSQEWMPVLIDERGDTIHYEYPPPDSSYVHNELIIKFRTNGLNLNQLCYVIPGPAQKEKKEKIQTIPYNIIGYLMSQRFYVDDLIPDSSFLAAIKSFGGDTLRRITWDNPCEDTISIARNGDTLKSENYLWMVLQFDNDTSVIDAAVF